MIDRSRRALLATALAAALPASFLPGAVLAQGAPEIRVGAIVPSTGPFAEWGRSNTVTLKMLEAEVNAAGGINGAKLRMVIYDDAARPAQAGNVMRKLAGDDKVIGVAGPLTSSAAEVVFPVANQLAVVSTSQASSKPGVAAANRPWAFRNTIDESVLAKVAVPFFKDSYKIGSVAIIYDAKDANAVSLGSRLMPALMKENGVKLLNEGSIATFNTGDLDVSAQVTAIKGLNPDGVVVAADYSQAITVIREMKRQGFVKPVIGGTPLISSAILKAVPEMPIVAPGTFYAGQKGEGVEKFAANLQPILRKESGLPAEIEPSMYDANIYEIVSMYLDAVRQAGVTGKPEDLAKDRERVRDHLASLKSFQGLAGPITFNADGDAVKAFFVFVGQNGAWAERARGCSSADGKGC